MPWKALKERLAVNLFTSQGTDATRVGKPCLDLQEAPFHIIPKPLGSPAWRQHSELTVLTVMPTSCSKYSQFPRKRRLSFI
ncbi:jg13271 [Pararge aegeria aegeria]|uniref:Jg13271 protein n=1 Tax=Pararge aegeria aegeria TaxID=348720 RepID=A0A8S4RER5_9NEOP|nr:jg13271 [Pararge aegeria aegeria]